MDNAASTGWVDSDADVWHGCDWRPSLLPSPATCRRRRRHSLPPRLLLPAPGAVVSRRAGSQHHLQQDSWLVSASEDALSGPP